MTNEDDFLSKILWIGLNGKSHNSLDDYLEKGRYKVHSVKNGDMWLIMKETYPPKRNNDNSKVFCVTVWVQF